MAPPPVLWCDVLEWNEYGVEAPHGHYEPVSYRGRANLCPKCLNAEAEPQRALDPRDDNYRHYLAGQGYSFHPASDDWHPCFHGGLIGICIYPPTEKWPWARIRVTGADDTCMAMKCGTYEEARAVVKALPCIISKGVLLDMGFLWD